MESVPRASCTARSRAASPSWLPMNALASCVRLRWMRPVIAATAPPLPTRVCNRCWRLMSENVASGFAIHVAKENLKFSAAHFIAYPGFREPLHGHNYQVGIRVRGDLSSSGYVLDFGLVKKLTKEIVDRLDERALIPARSVCLRIEPLGEQMRIRYEADEFILPRKDLCLLPIVHTSAEEL